MKVQKQQERKERAETGGDMEAERVLTGVVSC